MSLVISLLPKRTIMSVVFYSHHLIINK